MFIVGDEKEVPTPEGVEGAGTLYRSHIQLQKVVLFALECKIFEATRQELNVRLEIPAHFTPSGVRTSFSPLL